MSGPTLYGVGCLYCGAQIECDPNDAEDVIRRHFEQCENHPVHLAESLRLKLAEKEAECEQRLQDKDRLFNELSAELREECDRLRAAMAVQDKAAKNLVAIADCKVAEARKYEPEARAAVSTLHSEREANEILTNENDKLRTECERLRTAIQLTINDVGEANQKLREECERLRNDLEDSRHSEAGKAREIADLRTECGRFEACNDKLHKECERLRQVATSSQHWCAQFKGQNEELSDIIQEALPLVKEHPHVGKSETPGGLVARMRAAVGGE
jgi:chromosome segregation ATPase